MSGRDLEHLDLKSQWNDTWLPPLNKTFINNQGEEENLVFRPWQKHAVTFMKHCKSKRGYCLIGDDMGVGKVIPIHTFPLISDDPSVSIPLECRQSHQEGARAFSPLHLCSHCVSTPTLNH